MSTSLPPTKPPAEVHPMQALLDQGGYDMPQRGDIREGTVISVSPQEVVIDLGLKREAIVPANDLSRLDKATLAEVQEGSTWPVYILQPSDREGNLIVSLSRALQEKDWLIAQEKMEANEMFEARVTGHNAGGLEVEFGKLRGFVPASHLSSLPREMSPDERKAHLATFVGKTIPVKVVEVDRKRRRLIMSERAARRRWQREHRKQLLDDIQVGEVRQGTVRSLSEFGAFVDLGGADGLVHISELAWFPVAHPSEVLKVGQVVDVKVLRIDKQRERVGLSLKRVQPDPWSHIDELYTPNQLVEAVVTRVTDFGAFVRLRSGVEGLLHVSEMADIRPDHPQSLVSPGDLLLLRVLRIEPDRRRIGLSLRQVSESEWSEWAASYREKHAVAEAGEAEAAGEVEVAVEEAAGAEMDQFAMVGDELPLDEAVDFEVPPASDEDFEPVADVVSDEETADTAVAEEVVAEEALTEPETLSGEESSFPLDDVAAAELVSEEAPAEAEALSGEESSFPLDDVAAAELVSEEAPAELETLSGEESSLPLDDVAAAEFVSEETPTEPETLNDEESSLPLDDIATAEATVERATVSDDESQMPFDQVDVEAPAEPGTTSDEESSTGNGEGDTATD